MTASTVVETAESRTVGMGQFVVAQGLAHLSAVLGSCVGVALYHSGMKLGAFGHVVLPDSHGRSSSPGKFADIAIPAMLADLRQRGAAQSGLIAKIVGGACMFGLGGPLQIGDANTQAVLALLGAAGIPVVARDVGGTSGRRATLNCSNGKLTITTVGGPARII
jgi:chemotaxis protein CheD